MNLLRNKFFRISITLLSIVGYGAVVLSYGQLTNGTAPDPVKGYNVHEFILDPGCGPGDTGCFKNTSYWELANNNADIYFDFANVGVGTSAPGYKFEVQGDSAFFQQGAHNQTLVVNGDITGFGGSDNGILSGVLDDLNNSTTLAMTQLDYNNGLPFFKVLEETSSSQTESIIGELSTEFPGADKGTLSVVVDDLGNPTIIAYSLLNYNHGAPIFNVGTNYGGGATGLFRINKANGQPNIVLQTGLSSGESTSFTMTGNTSGEPQTTLSSTYINGGSASFNILPVNNEPRIAMQSLLSNGSSSNFTLLGDTTGEPEASLQSTFSNGNVGRIAILNNNGDPNPTMFVTDSITNSAASFSLSTLGDTSGYQDFSAFTEAPGAFSLFQKSNASVYSDTYNGEKRLLIGTTNSFGRTGGLDISTNINGYPEVNITVSTASNNDGLIRVGDDGTGQPSPMLQVTNGNSNLSYGVSAFSTNATYYRCSTNYPNIPGGTSCYDDRVVLIDDNQMLQEFWNSATTEFADRVTTGQLIHDSGVKLYYQNTPAGSSGSGANTYLEVKSDLSFFDGTRLCTLNSTTGTWACPSDLRLKKNINPLTSALDNINELNPVTYQFKTEPDNASLSMGLIAQEVENVYPTLVSTQASGTLAVNYGGFIPVLIKAIQELNLKVDHIQPIPVDGGITFDSLKTWFTDRANQLASIFVKTAHVEELCVGTENNETCLTKDQVDRLLLLQNSTSSPGGNSGTNGGTTSGTSDNTNNGTGGGGGTIDATGDGNTLTPTDPLPPTGDSSGTENSNSGSSTTVDTNIPPDSAPSTDTTSPTPPASDVTPPPDTVAPPDAPPPSDVVQ